MSNEVPELENGEEAHAAAEEAADLALPDVDAREAGRDQDDVVDVGEFADPEDFPEGVDE